MFDTWWNVNGFYLICSVVLSGTGLILALNGHHLLGTVNAANAIWLAYQID